MAFSNLLLNSTPQKKANTQKGKRKRKKWRRELTLWAIFLRLVGNPVTTLTRSIDQSTTSIWNLLGTSWLIFSTSKLPVKPKGGKSASLCTVCFRLDYSFTTTTQKTLVSFSRFLLSDFWLRTNKSFQPRLSRSVATLIRCARASAGIPRAIHSWHQRLAQQLSVRVAARARCCASP